MDRSWCRKRRSWRYHEVPVRHCWIAPRLIWLLWAHGLIRAIFDRVSYATCRHYVLQVYWSFGSCAPLQSVPHYLEECGQPDAVPRRILLHRFSVPSFCGFRLHVPRCDPTDLFLDRPTQPFRAIPRMVVEDGVPILQHRHLALRIPLHKGEWRLR